MLTSLTAAVQGLLAATPARDRRDPPPGVATVIRGVVIGAKRALEWYATQVLESAPLLNVLGHMSAAAPLHSVMMRQDSKLPINSNGG